MASKKDQNTGITGSKILAGTLYLVTTLLILGFLWQSFFGQL